MSKNNKVEITGNMGREAYIGNANGKPMAAVSIATNDSYQDKENEWQNKKEVWHQVLVFNPNTIEKIKNFKKGTRLKISGELSYRDFTAVIDGEEVTKQECSIIANDIEQAPLPKKQA